MRRTLTSWPDGWTSTSVTTPAVRAEIGIAGIVHEHVVAASKCVPLELQH